MQSAIHLTTTVLAGGRIDVVSPELRSGQRVELIVLLQEPVVARPSAVDILAGAPGDRQHRRGGRRPCAPGSRRVGGLSLPSSGPV
ncbi:MAG: hypothetical protein WCI05_10110 [Myxococcales bacterium]